ncbi:hypothetical protein BaRGS_00018149 [Batillaria attramentaria]|uniref:Uncharacterized protein n=1 Tax=Batillaria attramentaria TaxID=370345 RepID=A0ABD0KTX2_9CAEN
MSSVVCGNSPAKCPSDYRTRVETCIMEAQVAPQSGGGLTLVTNKDRIIELCDRGSLRKTIDCLEEIHTRCAHNVTILHELDRLFSVESWQQGEQLLCNNIELFRNNFDCLSRSAPSVATCIIMRTQIFKHDVTSADHSDHARLREITCSFAESIVKCLRRPIARGCPESLVETMVQALHKFLPPTCLTDNFITVTEDPMPVMTET